MNFESLRAALPAGDTLERLHADMELARLVPTWKYVADFVSREPLVSYRPWLWKWDAVLHHLLRAGELITPERGAERRSMEHTNPDLRSGFSTSHTLATAVQLVKAGERAPAHRHMAAAIRFAARSEGGDVFTTVEGEPLRMLQNDLLLTPSGTWHEHVNSTGHDIVWLDALDFPLVNLLQASWFEPGEPGVAAPREEGYSQTMLGAMRPTDWLPYPDHHPVVRYPWSEMRTALERLRGAAGSPFDDILLAYVNPRNGGPTLPTIGCHAQLLRPGKATQAHRQMCSTVYYVIEGAGHSVIEGQRFDWAEGDVFVVPNWRWHEHASAMGRDAILFSVSDEPVMRALGMYREQAFAGPSGRQEITAVFDPV